MQFFYQWHELLKFWVLRTKLFENNLLMKRTNGFEGFIGKKCQWISISNFNYVLLQDPFGIRMPRAHGRSDKLRPAREILPPLDPPEAWPPQTQI